MIKVAATTTGPGEMLDYFLQYVAKAHNISNFSKRTEDKFDIISFDAEPLHPVPLKMLFDLVCDDLHVTRAAILDYSTKPRQVARARALLGYCLTKRLGLLVAAAASIIGAKNHTTVVRSNQMFRGVVKTSLSLERFYYAAKAIYKKN